MKRTMLGILLTGVLLTGPALPQEDTASQGVHVSADTPRSTPARTAHRGGGGRVRGGGSVINRCAAEISN